MIRKCQDDGSVPVGSQRLQCSVLVRYLDTEWSRSGTTANHEECLRLVASKHEVFDHQSLTVQSYHITWQHIVIISDYLMEYW